MAFTRGIKTRLQKLCRNLNLAHSHSKTLPLANLPTSMLRGRQCRLEALEDRRLLSVVPYLVTSLADNTLADGFVTLREAIEAANTNAIVGDAHAGSDTETDIITFDPSLTSGTIVLGGTELSITEDLEIQGLGADRLTIDADGASRIFSITWDTSASISQLTLTGGNADYGGAIRTSGLLQVSDCDITNNAATNHGGGIYAEAGTLEVKDAWIHGNTATATSSQGGGILLASSAQGVLDGVTLSENSANYGGGVFVGGSSVSLFVDNSTLSDNTAVGGSDASGGGLHNTSSASVELVNTTVAFNTAEGSSAKAGGIITAYGGTVKLTNTIVAENTAPSGDDVVNYSGTFDATSDYNLIGILDVSTGLDTANTLYGSAATPLDPMLGPLADNGGFAPTHLPWDGSPTLDAGSNDLALDVLDVPLVTDQRGVGFDRIANGTVDLGAVEGSRAIEFALTDPVGARVIGEEILVTWDPTAVPVNSTISLYYDADGTFNGNETWFITDQLAPESGQISMVMPLTLPAGDYYFGGTLTSPNSATYDSRLSSAMSLSIGGTTYVVNSLEDNLLTDGLVTLREAIGAANANAAVGDAPAGSAAGADMITFAPALAGGTIVLNGTHLEINDDLILAGLGDDQLTVNADQNSRVFYVHDTTPEDGDAVRVGISGLTLTFGSVSDDGGAIYSDGELDLAGMVITNSFAYDDGGAIFTTGKLRLSDSTLTDNSAAGSSDPSGGAIYSSGDATLTNVDMLRNTAYANGGAIYTTDGDFTGTDLMLAMNTAYEQGGGLFLASGDLSIDGGVVSQNYAAAGGGGAFISSGNATLSGFDFIDNSVGSGQGGGLKNNSTGTVTIDTCSFTENTANYGGGIYDYANGSLTIRDSSINDNTASTEGGGLWDRYGSTRIYDTQISGNDGGAKGGGIYHYNVDMRLYDSQVNENRVSGTDAWGGGVDCYESGNFYAYRSEFSGNLVEATDQGYGGGVHVGGSVKSSFTDCTFADNRVSGLNEGYGGGVYLGSSYTHTFTRCTVSGNVVYGASNSRGGGICKAGNSSTLYVINSTISGNRAYGSASSSGGGLYLYDYYAYTTTIIQSTITLNEAAYGGGVYRDGQLNVRLRNTIVAGNMAEYAAPDVYGTFDASSAANLIGIIDGSTDLDASAETMFGTSGAPLSAGLAALADNGGYKMTHALLSTSPAIDTGNNAYALDSAGNPLVIDQTLGTRIVNHTVNIGAVELVVVPAFELTGPTGTISAGDWQLFSWDTHSIAADADFDIYADPDGVVNGNEIFLLEDADPSELGGHWDWSAIDLPAGTYTFGAVLTDRVSGVETTDRLAATTTIEYDQAYLVTSLADTVAVDGFLTLREAIAAANSNQPVCDAHAGRSDGVDIILFDPSLTGGTILLDQGGLVLEDDLSIVGLSQDDLTISGDHLYRPIEIDEGVFVRISGLTIRDGYTNSYGGGIENRGELVLLESTLTGNVALDDGGAIYSSGTLDIRDCIIAANTAQDGTTASGGGLFNTGPAIIADTLFFQNTAGVDGGGIWNNADLTLNRVTLRENTAFDDGGGLLTYTQLTVLQDCTIADNLSFDRAGGIYHPTGALRLRDSVLDGNSAAYGGGLYDESYAALMIHDSVLSNNTASTEGGGLWDRYGSTRIYDTQISGNYGGTKGGGIYHYYVDMRLYDSQVNENRVSGTDAWGGGVDCYESGNFYTYCSEFSGNLVEATDQGYGGGVYVGGSVKSSFTDCTIADNRVSGLNEGYGGGVFLREWNTHTFTRSTISGNVVYGASTSRGGGIYQAGYSTLYVINSTISGNRAYGSASSAGGGLYLYHYEANYAANITQSTITLNEAAYGGGVYRNGGVNVRLQNSIVAGNTADYAAPDVYGTFDASSAANLIGIIDGSTDLDASAETMFGTSGAPLSAGLAALADNGDYTLTHALLSTSPAIDTGNNAYALDSSGNPLTTDQRGSSRLWAGKVDIGAYEGSVVEGFELAGPTGLIEAGTPQTITWTGGTISADSLLSIYADPDGIINGNEIYLLEDANPNPLAGSFDWYAVDVPEGTYTLGAAVVDQMTGLAMVDRLGATVTVSYAGAYVVTSLADTVVVDGALTLREAIEAASTNLAVGDATAGRDGAVDVIRFHPSLIGGQIDITAGKLTITDDMAIQGLGTNELTLASDGTDRIFDVAENVLAWISDMTLTDGFTTGDGGAIRNAGTLVLDDLTFDGNRAYDDGGAVYNLGTLVGTTLVFTNNTTSGSSDPNGGALASIGQVSITDATFDNNTAANRGGGFYTHDATDADLTNVTFLGNSAPDGGAIYSRGSLIVETAFMQGNDATGSGGAICSTMGTIQLIDATVDSNTASSNGGGIYFSSGGSMVLINVAMTNNRATRGGAIYDSSGGAMRVYDSVLSNNIASTEGGGLWDQSGSTQIYNTQISGNDGGVKGGGICHYYVNMQLYDSEVNENQVSGTDAWGGGVYCNSSGTLSVERSEFSGNVVEATDQGYGGGVYTGYYFTSSFTDCTFADNRVSGLNEGYGGGVYLWYCYTHTFTRCTISGNVVYGASVSRGGGIYKAENYSTIYVINSTISGNRAYGSASSAGGGLYLYNYDAGYTATITQSTITLNEAAYGGGIYHNDDSQMNVCVRNTIVAGNTADYVGPDVYGTFDSSSAANLIGIIDGSADLDASAETMFGTSSVPLSPGLAALSDNGGYTQTHAILATSPVINAGNNSYALDSSGNPLTTDQRSGLYLRIIDGVTDIGAYEGSVDTYFALLAPSGGTVTAAWDTPVRWTGNVPISSEISIYYDTDDTFNGNEEWIVRNISYASLGGETFWQSVEVSSGDYTIGAVVTDATTGGYWEDRTSVFTLTHLGTPTLYVVESTADSIVVDGILTLREALEAANTNLPVGDAPAGDPIEMDIIQFDASLAARTITLDATLAITDNVQIEGTGDGDFRPTIDAAATGSVFEVASGVTARLSDLRITGGDASVGGGIDNAGTLLLENMEIFGNTASYGGGIANREGQVEISQTWIHDNTATAGDAMGGGIANEWGQVKMLDSTISANTAQYGGGLYSRYYGNNVLSNSTVSGNTATGTNATGGGILVEESSRLELINATVTENSANGTNAFGGGVSLGAANATLVNTIVANNTAPADVDVHGTFDLASDYNLIGVIDGSTNLDAANSFYGTSAAPLSAGLDSLADHGGPTPTHAVQTGSDVINGGNDAWAVDPNGLALDYDQRGLGYDRILNGAVDIGAFEFDALPGDNQAPVIGGLTISTDPVTVGDPLTLTATGVTDDHAVVAVTFYRDADGDGVGSPSEILGTDNASGDGWSWTGSVTWEPGQCRYLAVATDDGWPMGVQTSNTAAVVGTVVAATAPTIELGSYSLLAGATDLQIEVYVSGLDMVTGFNLAAQIGDGAGGVAEPVFQSVDFSGGIWDQFPASVSGGVVAGTPQTAQASVVFSNTGDEVLSDGLLCTLTIDTTGFSAGENFDLKLQIDGAGQSSEFLVYGGSTITPTVIDGTISLFDAEVVGRHVFYNNSAFDGNDPAANTADDDAIATDKQALLPGETATYANYTSYDAGINGIMIDLQGMQHAITSGAFLFRTGNSSDPSTWLDAPAPSAVVWRPGEGVGGSDRVVVTWPDGSITGEWLEVTVLASETGLASNDVFYFGNAPGESGNDPGNTYVDGTDMAAARDHFHDYAHPADITYDFDYNRDSLVNGTDMVIARDNATNLLTSLKLISIPTATATATALTAKTGTADFVSSADLPTIDIGTWSLVENQSGQEIELYVSIPGSTVPDVSGFNLRAQLGDGLDTAAEPKFEAIEFSSLWDAYPTMVSGGVVSGAQQFSQASIIFSNQGDAVVPTGALVTLTIDTTGFTAGQTFDLKLAGSDINADSDFILTDGTSLSALVVNGTIEIVETPPIPGDANRDGRVDGSDVTILAANWQAGVPNGDPQNVTWGMGDFNGDGKVDGSDVTILAGNWQAGVSSALVAVSTTEPDRADHFVPPAADSLGVATVPTRDSLAPRRLIAPVAKATDEVLTEQCYNESDFTAIAKDLVSVSAKKSIAASDRLFALEFDPYSDL